MRIFNICPFCLNCVKFSKMTFSLCINHHLICRNQLLIGIANFTGNTNTSVRHCVYEECRPVFTHVSIPLRCSHLVERAYIINHFISDYIELLRVFNLENIANFNCIICYACIDFSFIFNFIPIFRLYCKFNFLGNISIIRLYIF